MTADPLPESSANQSLVPARLVPVIGALIIGAASLGFIAGMREPPAPIRASAPNHKIDAAHAAIPAAVRYNQLPDAQLRNNADWKSTLTSLKFETPDVFAPVIRTEALKQQALADRAAVRAFDGAPPMIPHPVDQQSAASCLACHGPGVKVGDRIATRMSHPLMTNCTQCHVPAAPPFLSATTATASATPSPADIENTFVGIIRAGPGSRAWPGAPPTIPHTTWMRQDCTSCHGLLARPGLRTTHIWRTNCTQCHAPSATLDQAALAPF